MKTKSFREALKEKILNDCTDDYEEHFLFYEDTVIEVYNEYTSQFQQEWIPVEERLPEEGLPVLIITDYGMQDVCHLSFSETGTLWVNHMRQQHSNGGVVAWQPLPQPYNPTKS